MSAPADSSSAGAALRATPITMPNPPARPAATPASASSTTTARSGRDRQARRGLEESVRRRLAAQAERFDVAAVHDVVEQRRRSRPSAAPRGSSCSTRRRPCCTPASRRSRTQRTEPGNASTLAGVERAARRAPACGRRCCARATPRLDPAGGQEIAHAVLARLAVDVGDVVALDVERRLRPLGEQRRRTSASSRPRAVRLVAVSTPSRSKRTASKPGREVIRGAWTTAPRPTSELPPEPAPRNRTAAAGLSPAAGAAVPRPSGRRDQRRDATPSSAGSTGRSSCRSRRSGSSPGRARRPRPAAVGERAALGGLDRVVRRRRHEVRRLARVRRVTTSMIRIPSVYHDAKISSSTSSGLWIV